MKIYIPSPLRSYTQQMDEVDAEGSNLAELLTDLNRLYPGLRFRVIDEQDGVREHIKIFVNREQALDLNTPVRPEDEVSILCALSGG
jgi:molybdopterin synthase sulfur carrier subunit